MINDDLLFIIGITIAIIAFVLLVVLTVLFKIKEIKLSAQFDKEYGEYTKVSPKYVRKSKRKYASKP